MTTLLRNDIPSPIGRIILVARASGPGATEEPGLCAVEFEDCLDRLHRHLESRFGSYDLRPTAEPGRHAKRLAAYFAGELEAIDDLPLDSGGTVFQQQVWRQLRRIPAGTTRRYGELARDLGRPAAARAVGAANGRNPFSIVVPCHRLVASTGNLTGYAGGLHRKRWLLRHEGAIAD